MESWLLLGLGLWALLRAPGVKSAPPKWVPRAAALAAAADSSNNYRVTDFFTGEPVKSRMMQGPGVLLLLAMLSCGAQASGLVGPGAMTPYSGGGGGRQRSYGIEH